MGKKGGIRNVKRRRKVYERLAARDGPGCFYCGCEFDSSSKKRTRTLDHFVPQQAGGTSGLDNLRLSCSACNRLKGLATGDEYLASRRLIARRKRIEIEQELTAGTRLARRAFHHSGLRWAGEDRWHCTTCGSSGADRASSPARSACLPSASRPLPFDAMQIKGGP